MHVETAVVFYGPEKTKTRYRLRTIEDPDRQSPALANQNDRWIAHSHGQAR